MIRNLVFAGLALGLVSSLSAADNPAPRASLTAAEIVSRNVAARGGLDAWRSVRSLLESGKMGAGGDNRQTLPTAVPGAKRPAKDQPLPSSSRLAQEAQLPFQLEMERPRKVRLEIQFAGKTAVQVYDGTSGWKLRPYLNRLAVEPFTENELRLAAMQSELDGPLVDFAARGTKVELEGTDKVEDHDSYRLKLTYKDGRTMHVWIDAATFLEAKVEGTPRKLDGIEHPVEVYYRDYRTVDGLKIPFVLETHVLPVADQPAAKSNYRAEKIVIDKVTVNPKLEASLFTKPTVETAAVALPKR